MITKTFLCFISILYTVHAQVRIGDLFFPVTVQPPSFEIFKNEPSDTVYDEIVNIQPDNELHIPTSLSQMPKNEKTLVAFSPPAQLLASSKFKASDISYKTDEMSSKDAELTKPFVPPQAIQFKQDSGIPFTSPMFSQAPAFGFEPIITMSHELLENNDTPEVETKTLPPLALLSGTNDVIDQEENKIEQENTSVNRKMEVIVSKLENDIQRLDLEVNVLKDLVRKLLRHVYREKKKNIKRHEQVSGSTVIKENLRAVQTLDSSSSEPFLHTWKKSHHHN